MIENTKRQKNLEAEEAEQDDTLLEEDYDFDDDYDDDDEFTNAFTKVPEPVISPPVKKKSNVFVPATGLKNSDPYSDERQLIGGSNDTTPMASFIGGGSFQPYEGSGRRTATNIYPVQEEFSEEPIQPESFHQEEQSIPPMIEMSSSSNDNNSPRDELYQESGFGGDRNSGIGGIGVALNNDIGESGSLTTKDFNDQMDEYDQGHQGQGGHGLDMPEVNTNAQQGFPVQPVGSA